MSGQEDASEKSHEPTQRKLDEARRKGEIARAPDLTAAMAYLGLYLGALAFGVAALTAFADALLPLVEHPHRLIDALGGVGSTATAGQVMAAALTPLLPLFLLPAGLVLLSLLATRTLIFTPSKLAFKLSRISPIENAKNKFGRRGLFEFLKSLVKLGIYTLCLAFFLRANLDRIVGSVQAEPGAVTVIMLTMMVQLLGLVVLIALVIGGLDFFWQRGEHLRKNRMSQKEMRDEYKTRKAIRCSGSTVGPAPRSTR